MKENPQNTRDIDKTIQKIKEYTQNVRVTTNQNKENPQGAGDTDETVPTTVNPTSAQDSNKTSNERQSSECSRY